MSFSKPEVLQNTPGGDAVNQSVMKNDANIDDVYTNLNSLDASKAASSHSHGDATTSADGFMSHVDKLKLDGIEEGASVGMSGAEIKVAYEAEPNTNAYTDADKSKVGHVTVTQAVNLDTIESNTATNNAKVTNATHSGDVSGSTTLTIGNDKVTYAKMQNIPTANILGRVSSSTGNVEDLTTTQVRTLLNVENGATADLTAAQILALLLTVDSDSSGLNATTLQGHAPSYFAQVGGDYTKKFQCDWATSGSDAINLSFATSELVATSDVTVYSANDKIVRRSEDGDIAINTRLYLTNGSRYLEYNVVGGRLHLYNGSHTYEINMTQL